MSLIAYFMSTVANCSAPLSYCISTVEIIVDLLQRAGLYYISHPVPTLDIFKSEHFPAKEYNHLVLKSLLVAVKTSHRRHLNPPIMDVFGQ